LIAALNAFVEVEDALFNVGPVHVLLVNLGAAPLDDLVADLGQQRLHLFVSVVELRDFPNHPHIVEDFR